MAARERKSFTAKDTKDTKEKSSLTAKHAKGAKNSIIRTRKDAEEQPKVATGSSLGMSTSGIATANAVLDSTGKGLEGHPGFRHFVTASLRHCVTSSLRRFVTALSVSFRSARRF